MKVRSLCGWTTREGKYRRIRLFEAWCNLLGRCRGTKSKDAGKYWKAGNEFGGWKHFREWALKSGYRKGMQLDRVKGDLPYCPDNCQWLTAVEHSRKSIASHKFGCRCRWCLQSVRVLPELKVPRLEDPTVPF